MDERKRLPAPVTTTEEFLHATVVELRALVTAVEKLAEVLTPIEVELVADAADWPDVVELVEAGPESVGAMTADPDTPADEVAPKKSWKKVAE